MLTRRSPPAPSAPPRYDHVQKSVLYGPFRYHPSPFWNTTNRNAEAIAREALRFHARPSLAGILPLAKQALLG